ncbi:MAG TPA: hypothetical protein VFQ53_00670 [Kofleriaceae bacterium]|nr:hypothetical protein [Kofleriaceae bacterium]
MPVRLAQIGTVFEVELDRQGSELVERRLGPAPSEDRKQFVDDEAALAAYHARIAELLESRWTRRTPCETVGDVATRELLDAVTAGDRDAIEVYNDLLIERGDVCGEYASLRAIDAPDARVRDRLAELEQLHRPRLYGVFGALPDAARAHFELVWRHGWIYEVIVRWRTQPRDAPTVTLHDALYALLHAPMARFVQSLDLERELANTSVRCPHTDQITTLRISGPATLEALAAYPALRELEIVGHADVDHPTIETVILRMVGRQPRISITGQLPNLRRLVIVLTDPDRHAFAALRDWVRSLRPPRVDELAIWGRRRLSAAVIEALAASPLVDTLRILELAPAPAPAQLDALALALADHDEAAPVLLLHPMPARP